MVITTRKAHPENKGRAIATGYARIMSVGTSGPGPLPEALDVVSVTAVAEDGADPSVSSRATVRFTLDDDPDHIEALIKRLTELRAAQRRREER